MTISSIYVICLQTLSFLSFSIFFSKVYNLVQVSILRKSISGRHRPDVDLRRMLTGSTAYYESVEPDEEYQCNHVAVFISLVCSLFSKDPSNSTIF